MTTPFHDGELAVQRLVGVQPGGGGGIRDAIGPQQARFFQALPFVVVGAEGEGWPAATLLEGPPGFVSAPSERRLTLALALDDREPTQRLLVAGAEAAVLGIDLSSRRRNRVNGRVARRDAEGLELAVAQSFGNCPQYIHPRVPRRVAGAPGPVELLPRLDGDARAQLAAADTFFVATTGGARGADVSHRGGPPGFAALEGDTLTIPDYPGNRYFQTLGNLLVEPRAALLFVDFATGDLLHLRGPTEVLWEGRQVAAVPGAERLWRVRVEAAWRRRAGVGLRWDPGPAAAVASAR